jgi:tRNA pseudouridine55 synthase
MQGIILIDKPENWTSFDVVNYVRKMVAGVQGKKSRQVKCGHTGTLDPAATGLLVLCVGREYTKKVPQLIKQDKTYEVEVTLGKISTTGDKEGEISDVSNDIPQIQTINKVLKGFLGNIQQTPPAFSAIKIDGKRAYELARAGIVVNIKPREVTIHSIEGIKYEYPKIKFTTRVGSGTYIRSLVVDIGEKLGVGAYMSALRRTSIGDATLAQAYTVSELTNEILVKTLDTTG